ncbi:MAG: LpxI family protein [Alphaproteobacteria bacterium]|nr:MAG: LpxI family protein [Alphaproteobacteria bacterium]
MAFASQNNGGGRIGIIAGSGRLPLALALTLQSNGGTPYLMLVEGEADPVDYAGFPHEIIPITKVGRFLKALARENCQSVTLAGPVHRPDFKNILPDVEGMKLLARLTRASRKGDDGLMRTIAAFLQEKGFTVVGAHELASDLLAPLGAFGKHEPGENDKADITTGIHIVKEIGRLDIGQAAIIREGYVLAVEAAEGTDGLLKRSREFAWGHPAGVLVKLSKPQQDLRSDMPTIGRDTVQAAKEAGLKGIAVEGGKTLVLDLKEVVREADAAGLFIVGVETDGKSE